MMIANKLSRVTGMLHRLNGIVSKEMLLTFYNSLLRSYINYWLLVWSKSSHKIETLKYFYQLSYASVPQYFHGYREVLEKQALRMLRQHFIPITNDQTGLCRLFYTVPINRVIKYHEK